MNDQAMRAPAVFVSYSRIDAAFASEVVISLECCGFDPRIDQHDLPPGEQWERELHKMIERASSTVFVLSSASLASVECRKELDHALAKGKRVIPLVIDEAAEATAPETLRRVQFIRFVGKGRTFAMGIADLAKALKTDIAWVDDHTRYTDRAEEWSKRQKPTSHLLPDDALARALAWLGEPASAGMKVTAEVADYINSSKQHAEETERRRIEARALERQRKLEAEMKEAKQKSRRRLATVATSSAFVLITGGATAIILVQQADASSVVARRQEEIADLLTKTCASAPMATDVADVEGARAKLNDQIDNFAANTRAERHKARTEAADILSRENNAALNQGFFELVTDRARRESGNRYTLLLGMADTFAQMSVPLVVSEPREVRTLLQDLKKAANDATLHSSLDAAIERVVGPT